MKTHLVLVLFIIMGSFTHASAAKIEVSTTEAHIRLSNRNPNIIRCGSGMEIGEITGDAALLAEPKNISKTDTTVNYLQSQVEGETGQRLSVAAQNTINVRCGDEPNVVTYTLQVTPSPGEGQVVVLGGGRGQFSSTARKALASLPYDAALARIQRRGLEGTLSGEVPEIPCSIVAMNEFRDISVTAKSCYAGAGYRMALYKLSIKESSPLEEVLLDERMFYCQPFGERIASIALDDRRVKRGHTTLISIVEGSLSTTLNKSCEGTYK